MTVLVSNFHEKKDIVNDVIKKYKLRIIIHINGKKHSLLGSIIYENGQFTCLRRELKKISQKSPVAKKKSHF